MQWAARMAAQVQVRPKVLNYICTAAKCSYMDRKKFNGKCYTAQKKSLKIILSTPWIIK